MIIGILGSNGFLGSELLSQLSQHHEIQAINRQNYNNMINKFFDVFINANGNSKRWWANENPLQDFEKSVLSVYNSIFDFKFKKYIYISSYDVYKKNTYGFHKKLAEQIVCHHSKYFIILRCSAIIGKHMKKGVLKDIMNGKPLYVSAESTMQLITNTEVANFILFCIEQNYSNKIFNLGSINAILVEDMANMLKIGITTKPGAVEQHYCEDVTETLEVFKLKTAEEYIKEII